MSAETTTTDRPTYILTRAEVRAVVRVSPSIVRVTFGGDALSEFGTPGEVFDSRIKLVFPPATGVLPDLGTRHPRSGPACFCHEPLQRRLGGHEDDHFSRCWVVAFPVTAPRRLCHGINSGRSPVHGGKIDIDPGFDQLRADDPAAHALFQPSADYPQHRPAVGRIHQGAEMEMSCVLAKGLIEVAGMGAGIDDAQNLFACLQVPDQRGIVPNACMGNANPPMQITEQSAETFLRNDFPDFIAAKTGRKNAAFHQNRLGCRTQNDGDPVASNQFAQCHHRGGQKTSRQHLDFIQNHHTACDIVQLATP